MLQKNIGLAAGLGFGQGDDLVAQVENQIMERRKRGIIPTSPVGYGMTGIGSTPTPGTGSYSPGIMALLGQGGLGA